MKRLILIFLLLFSLTAGTALQGQSFLQFNYGASFPSGSFGEDTEVLGSGHAQTGLGLQAEWYTMLFNPVGVGLHYSFSFNSADFLRTGYRYAESYSNIVGGKYAMHDISALVLVKAYSSEFLTTSIRLSGGTSFVSYPDITKRFFENDKLIDEQVLFETASTRKYLYGIGAGIRYAVSGNTGVSFTVDYQNRFGGETLHDDRNFNIEQVFVVLGIDFKLGKQ